MRHFVALAALGFAAFLISREWYFWPIVIALIALDAWFKLEQIALARRSADDR